MIERYTRPEMAAIWTVEKRYQTWLKVEILATEAWAELGEVPKEAIKVIREKAKFDPKKIDEIEKVVKHDVIAFLTSVNESIGPESRFLHKGMTSSDLIDTSFAVLLKEASEIIISDIKRCMEVLKRRAMEHKMTPTVGRSHGIHAEPVSFGLKMVLMYEEMKRNLARMERARDVISCGAISGAVGTFANIPPFVEEYVCKRLGLTPEPVSTQVVQRDRHAEFFTTLALIASSIENFSVELRHLQRTEVLEAEEYFSPGQKGSSAMPHKRNPISAENLTGLARLVRSNSFAAMENVALWHERDISHSSVERVIGPDSTIMMNYMLNRFADLMDKLIVYPENMMKNLNQLHGLIHSQRVLLALTTAGASREEAYNLVQRNAMRVWAEGKDFKELLLSDQDVARYLDKKEIENSFDLNYHLKNVDYIFNRVFK
ncbi:MAG: adenylosuccinate lyase [Deltaproteobacteria bacterium]|nr:adenylosuccinate lyase [Deltaproteobacteria bacterium]